MNWLYYFLSSIQLQDSTREKFPLSTFLLWKVETFTAALFFGPDISGTFHFASMARNTIFRK